MVDMYPPQEVPHPRVVVAGPLVKLVQGLAVHGCHFRLYVAKFGVGVSLQGQRATSSAF